MSMLKVQMSKLKDIKKDPCRGRIGEHLKKKNDAGN